MHDKFDSLCRMCIQEDSSLISIFVQDNEFLIPEMIRHGISIEIDKDDNLPANICKECLTNVEFIYEYRKKCQDNDVKLREYLVMSKKEEDFCDFITPKVEFESTGAAETLDGNLMISKEEIDPESGDEEWVLPKDEDVPSSSLILKEENHSEITPSDYDDVINDSYNASSESALSDNDEVSEINSRETRSRQNEFTIRKNQKKRKIAPRRNDNKCYLCNESFETGVQLSEHFPKHLDKLPFTCEVCILNKVVIKTLAGLNLHLKMHEQPIKCSFCDNRYSSANARRGHELAAHLKVGKDPMKCEICQKECPSKRSYKEHQKIHKKEHQCQTCLKSFISRSVLKRHEILHTGEKPYECTICNQKFNHISNYKTHLKRHTGEKAHSCNLCPATFLISNYLKDHIRVHHGETEFVPKRNLTDLYICTIVDKTTNKREYKCKTCGKVFPTSTHITHHLRTHNKAHQCSHCGRTFKDARALADHENTHTGRKPHACKTCGKKFANSSNLYQHNKIHTGVKNHKCEICLKTFTYRENLKTHIRIHHTTEKPFECIICYEKFNDNMSLKKHREWHLETPVSNADVKIIKAPPI